MSTSGIATTVPLTREEWRQALNDLPEVKEIDGQKKIPAFFFAHGSPMLIWPESQPQRGPMTTLSTTHGPKSTLAHFLQDFGPALLEKYNPKGLVVFSAHWEANGDIPVTDYGNSNPLLYDYYGFPPELYNVNFSSRGDAAMSNRVAEHLSKAGIPSKTVPVTVPRGRDGRGFNGPGLDHGVFVPFKHMFGDSCPVPIVEVAIDGSLSPERNWALGQAINDLRSEGYLILSGGLTVHTFEDFEAWGESTASPALKSFHSAIIDAARISHKVRELDLAQLRSTNVVLSTQDARKSAMSALTQHPGFRKAHPREDHFVPIYVAAGAGEEGETRVLLGQYGTLTFAFGV